MIRRTYTGDPSFCARDVYGTRIEAFRETYGSETDGVSFYVQTVNGQITAILSNVYGHGTLCCTDSADHTELLDFICFLSLQSLLCERSVLHSLALPKTDEGIVMRYCGERPTQTVSYITPRCAAFSYRDIHELLLTCGFSVGDYMPWLSDIALRVQHDTADVLCVLQNNRPVSTASVLFRTQTALCIGAVCTLPDFRGEGLVGSLVREIVRCAGDRRVELFCKPELAAFYERIGFQRNGEFGIWTFSR